MKNYCDLEILLRISFQKQLINVVIDFKKVRIHCYKLIKRFQELCSVLFWVANFESTVFWSFYAVSDLHQFLSENTLQYSIDQYVKNITEILVFIKLSILNFRSSKACNIFWR